MKNFEKFMERMKSQSRTDGSWGCEDFIRDVYEDEKIEYDFSKVNLKNLSKKQLIKIIYDLKERLDIYETN